MNKLNNLHDISVDNLALLEQYQQEFLQDPRSLDSSWRLFFEGKEPPALAARVSDAELYRLYGHLEANVYPVGIKSVEPAKELIGLDPAFRAIYCGSIGYEFYPYCSQEIQDFIISRIEPIMGRIDISKEKKLALLHLLNKAESFETFLHTKYVGQKRFSLEGAETLIPMLATLLDKNLTDLVIGMPHRGRLNVLVNILEKSYKEVFSEFEDVSPDTFESSGDVKYHKGYASKTGATNVVLAANPSHLESVDGVVEGIARALQQASAPSSVLPVLVHGDAAVSGQGVVYETLQLSKLAGYKTGGSLHIVINNHIGFTTLPVDGRSTYYCTDIAKAFGCPVFHVNAEEPESCLFAMELAYDIRQRFQTDVFIDLNCWRKYGHNESDEPAFTQPLIYKAIRTKPSIRTQYHDRLVKQGVEVGSLDEEFKNELNQDFATIQAEALIKKKEISARKVLSHEDLFKSHETKVSQEQLLQLLAKLTDIPEGFTLHPRLLAQVEARRKGKLERIDWALAESLAFGTLLEESIPIRLAGQDSQRGTFSQRHGVWVDQMTGKKYIPHAVINKDFEIVDSLLSEYAACAFEYGYSLARPKALVLWEAQFGDFANGAQIVIDQYLAPGQQKWGAHANLVLLLPHGYEGQGPEHSSARIERFLTLCAEDNIIVAYPTTPAQYFHLLRRQVKMQIPLIVFTPKGLLRSPDAISPISDLTSASLQEVLDDVKEPQQVQRLLFCSGRIYYDLAPYAKHDTAIIRIEQLYPLAARRLEEIIGRYKNAEVFFWVQEEPYNMGARGYIQEPLEQLLPRNAKLEYRGRAASSSPASGSHLVHEKEHELIHESLFRGQTR